MENGVSFSYIKMVPYLRSKLDKVLMSAQRLNIAKLSYSIQELQTLNILGNEDVSESIRILSDANNFLSSIENFGDAYRLNSSNVREKYEGSIITRDLGGTIEINLSDLESTALTIADLSFKANKFTKLICDEIPYLIIKGTNKENNDFRAVIQRLKRIYGRANSERGKRVNVTDEIDLFSEELDNGIYAGWKANIVDTEGNTQDILRRLYIDLSQIWDLEKVLYEMKTQLNKQLVRLLIDDNYKTFKHWGFSKDENGMWVLNFDSPRILERYSYHVPDLNKILNPNIVRKITSFKRFEYRLSFTNGIRKKNLDRVDTKTNAIDFLKAYRERFVKLLEDIDEEFLYGFISNDNEQAENKSNISDSDIERLKELYTLSKFMTKRSFERIKKEFPNLALKCEILEEIIVPENIPVLEYITEEELIQSTGYEESIRIQIEQNLASNRKIFVQHGSNLDKNASIYALRRHMRDKFAIREISVNEINAGENVQGKSNNGLIIDAGNLIGNTNFTATYLGRKSVNANVSRAQKSTCGVLSQVGIYVPHKIVQYADGVFSDERILIARWGVNLARFLKDKALFDFAETKRNDGTFLMEAYLTDEELKSWNLYEQCMRREEEIQRDIDFIKENIYTINDNGIDKKVAIVDRYVNCGAMISYSLGCDYYVSIADKQADFISSSQNLFENDKSIPKATFTMTANPKKGDGKLPYSVIKWCTELRDNGENSLLKMVTRGKVDKSQKPFVKPTGDMVVFGGPKTPNLFVTLNRNLQPGERLSEIIKEELKSVIGVKDKVLDGNRGDGRKAVTISAKSVAGNILHKGKSLSGLDVGQAGEALLNITRGEGENVKVTSD